MSEPKFTLGPWETLDLGEAIIVQPTDKTLHPICLVDRQRNVLANATLIAAAPDMYEALNRVRGYVEDEVKRHGGIDECDIDYRSDLECIDAALAKSVKP